MARQAAQAIRIFSHYCHEHLFIINKYRHECYYLMATKYPTLLRQQKCFKAPIVGIYVDLGSQCYSNPLFWPECFCPLQNPLEWERAPTRKSTEGRDLRGGR